MHGSKSTNRAYAPDLKAMRMRITRGGIRTAKRNPTRSAGICPSAGTPRERVVGGSSSFWPAMGSSAPAAAVAGGEAMEGAEDRRLLRCVNCGRGMRSLFVQYSPGNIRLMKCEHCKAVADPYIECEFMIILIDLILHKRKAYRHLLFNMLNLGVGGKGILWKSTLLYFVLDVCRFSLLTSNKACLDSSGSLLVSTLTCGKVLGDVLLGKLIFISVLLLGTRFLLNLPFDMIRYRHIVLAVIISSYLRLFLIAMMVWEFPSSVLLIVDILVLSSNALALGVITELPTAGCVAVCFGAHASTFFVNHWLEANDHKVLAAGMRMIKQSILA